MGGYSVFRVVSVTLRSTLATPLDVSGTFDGSTFELAGEFDGSTFELSGEMDGPTLLVTDVAGPDYIVTDGGDYVEVI